ncbi:hypothetical protein FVEN_g560 [Fusarium venenatum]|uniref:Uncharacterized protein n=1 Tax=Fusarium venenatum TaxID=56646 RepID=A0A2L2T0L1_9HYPO|nr:uncharacterized protein FVRRES_07305 [Fusarium venenatum]KAG8362275.1 hypothetical protein FVEN_g560 [Fusarium venenatum]CEI62869.1 unnamed protein product [Fusarium venenatum]
MPNHSSQYSYVRRVSVSLLDFINDIVSPAARLKKDGTDNISPVIVGVSVAAWGVFVFLAYIRYINLLINKWRTIYSNWRVGGLYPKNEDQVEGPVGEQSPLVKKVQKKVRFSDEKTIVPGARDPIPT